MADRQVVVIMSGLKNLNEKVVRSLILDVTANLIETTPVDTGWAKANWVPAIGRPFSALGVSATPEPSQLTLATARQQSGIAEAATWKWGQGKAFVSNNVPYIRALNDGSSKQAPAGFVQFSIDRALRDTRHKFNRRRS